MKLFKKSKSENTVTNIVDRELSTIIAEQDILLIQKHQQSAQKLSALRFSEIPKTSTIAEFTSTITLDYQKIADTIDNRLNGELQSVKGETDITDMKASYKEVSRKIEETEDTLAVVNAKFDPKGKEHKSAIVAWSRVLLVLYFLGGFELLANLEIYSILGGGILSAAAIAIISGIIVFYWAHITPSIVARFGGNNWKRQVLVFSLMALPIFAIFYLFSMMRVTYLNALNPEMEKVFLSSPLVPTLVNFFAYLVATYLVHEFRPSKQVKKAYKKYKDDLQELKGLQHKREVLITEQQQLEPNLRQRLIDYKNIQLLGKQLEQEVQTRMYSCFHEFKAELYLKTNGKCARLFTQTDADLRPLKLNYQHHTPNDPIL